MLFWIRTAFRGNGSTYRWVCIASAVCALAGSDALTLFLAASDASSVPAAPDINRYAKDLVAASGLASFAIVLTIVSLVAAVMVIHALIGSVANARIHALSVYRILGASPRYAGMVFLLECAVFSASGAAVGAGIGTLLARPTNAVLAHYNLAPHSIVTGPRISAVVTVFALVVVAAAAGSRSGYRDVMAQTGEIRRQRKQRRRSVRLLPLAIAAVFLSGAVALAALIPPSESAINSAPFGVALLAVIGAALLTPAVSYAFAAATTLVSHITKIPNRPAYRLRIGGRWSATGASRSARIAIPITLAVAVVAVIFSLAQTGRSASEYDKLRSVAAKSVLDTSTQPENERKVSADANSQSVSIRGDSRWTVPGQQPTVISLFRITHPEELPIIFPGITSPPPLTQTLTEREQGLLRVLSGDPSDSVGDKHRWIAPDGHEVTVLIVGTVSANRYLRYRYLVDEATFPQPPDTSGYIFYSTTNTGVASVPTRQWIEDQLQKSQRTQTAGIAAIVIVPIILCSLALLGVVMNIRRELLPGRITLHQLGFTRIDITAAFAIIAATSIIGALITAIVPLVLTIYCEQRIVHGLGYEIPIDIPIAPIAATALALSLMAILGMAVGFRGADASSCTASRTSGD